MSVSIIGHEIEKGEFKPYRRESFGYAFLALLLTIACVIIFAAIFI